MKHSVFIVLTGWLVFAWAGDAVAQNQGRLRAHVEQMTAGELAGRRAGTKGHELAASYIAEQMRELGLEPAGAEGYLQPVEVVHEVEVDTASLRVGARVLAPSVGFGATGFSDDGAFEGRPVFVGYGLSTNSYDDYAGVDVRDRVVIAFTGGPPRIVEQLPPASRYLLEPEAKAAVALAHGARALLLINDPEEHGERAEQRADELPRVAPQHALANIVAMRLTAKAAMPAFTDSNIDLTRRLRAIDRANRPLSGELPIKLKGELRLERQVATVHNVVGKLPGDDARRPVVLGAHYDHLGEGQTGSRWDGKKMVHPGADDNASGIAVLLEAARALKKAHDAKNSTVYFAALTAEELGMRGSRRLAAELAERGAVGIYVNMDMVGRLRDPGLHVLGAEEHDELRTPVSEASTKAGVTLVHGALQASDSDHHSFSDYGFRVMHLTTGRHADYHMPTDTIEKLNWEGLESITTLVVELMTSLASS